jgi:hypothetical protein
MAQSTRQLPNRTFRTQFRQLTGGLNNNEPASELHDSECQAIRDITFYDNDVRQRPGYYRLNATQDAGGLVGLGLFEFDRKDGTRKRIAKFGTRFVTFDGVDGTAVTINSTLQTGVDATGQARFAEGDNRIVIANRGDSWVYNGTTFRRVGKAAPTVAPLLASGGAGTPNGQYRVYLRFYSSEFAVESPKTATSAIFVVNSIINITINAADIAALDAYYDQVSIYVQPPGSTLFFRFDTKATAGPHAYNIADSALTALTADPFTTLSEPIGVLPGMKYLAYIHGRAFWAGDPAEPSRLYYSEATDPDLVLINNFIDLDPQAFGNITGLEVLFDQLVIYKESAIAIMTPTGGRETWEYTVIVKGTGALEGAVIVNANNRHVLLDERGVFVFDGIAVQQVSMRIEGSIIDQLEVADAEFFAAHHDTQRKSVVFSVRTRNSAVNDKELVWFYAARAPSGGPGPWSEFTIPATAYGHFHDIDGNLVTIFQDRRGFLYRRNSGSSDGRQTVLAGTATAGGADTLDDTTASPFQTGGSHVLGMPIAIVAGKGAGQIRSVLSVVSTSRVQVDAAWGVVPDATSVYHVGAIYSFWQSRSEEYDAPNLRKRIYEVVSATGEAGSKVKWVNRRVLQHSIRFENYGGDTPWNVRSYTTRWSIMDHRSPGTGALVVTTQDMV